ncbi:MAG: DUF4331 domain-containing protein [Candidatus Eremiobacteraeota bacterium]|nr:DUF4331 domain-containing protein [Candidatus Eremiobacteraeota bacterium]
MLKNKMKLGLVLLASTLALAACNGSGNTNPGGGNNNNNGALGNGPYKQLDRLNRPAVSEVFATFGQHDANNRDTPNDDATTLKPEIVNFMQKVAGRSPAIAGVVGSVLTPDVVIADLSGTSQSCIGVPPGGCNNYLGLETGGATQAPAGLKPFGGRALTDDIISISLGVIFGGTVPALGLAPEDSAEQDGRTDNSGNYPGGQCNVGNCAGGTYPANHRPNLTTDNVTWQTAPKHFTTTFPYLGAPQ